MKAAGMTLLKLDPAPDHPRSAAEPVLFNCTVVPRERSFTSSETPDRTFSVTGA